MTDRCRDLRVSEDGTHHVGPDGNPAYDDRFDQVLPFHAPGLAPVRRAGVAWHLRVDATAAYAARFRQTFGFYEGLAAVEADDGWHHVDATGVAVYSARYAWCGNVQGGRVPVRRPDGRYLHLAADGRPASGSTWRYAGDYREGSAVVQRDDGLHSHVDRDGALVHGCWFVDLDVFHKGLARARDDRGWTHVDRSGRPVTTTRYTMVEPFYNGQARVERVDGALVVIDPMGAVLAELRTPRRSEFAILSRDLVGFWSTDAIAAAVSLGLFEALPGTTHSLAATLGLHGGRLAALLRALHELDLVVREQEAWACTERGAFLRRDAPLTLADAALEYAGPLRRLWERLPDALRSPAWEAPDVFGDVAADATRTVPHHRMLRSYARHDYGSVPAALGLRGNERVLDVGVGVGVLTGMLLAAYPGLSVVALDRPEVLAQFECGDDPRVELLPVDLFATWGVQADVAVLARVLHDWDDARAVCILQNVRAALAVGDRVFVVELLVTDDGAFGGLCDLHLLMTTGGRERTLDEYATLLRAASFDVVQVHTLAALPSVIEGVAR